ncbi:hypothetical protein HPB50_028232 [Hyalomma asiaticum]|nr:hypothetical protein HPB50_028232 [Hyalomma asiaticum]
MSRVFELVNLWSDLRADAATERDAATALQGQLVEARREIAELQRRAWLWSSPSSGRSSVAERRPSVTVGPAVQGVPGYGAVAGSTAAADVGAARGLTYAAVLSLGAPTRRPGSGPTCPAGASGQRGSLTGATHERVRGLPHAHQADGRAGMGRHEAAQEQHQPGRRGHTRRDPAKYEVWRHSLLAHETVARKMQRAVEANSVTRAAVSSARPREKEAKR